VLSTQISCNPALQGHAAIARPCSNFVRTKGFRPAAEASPYPAMMYSDLAIAPAVARAAAAAVAPAPDLAVASTLASTLASAVASAVASTLASAVAPAIASARRDARRFTRGPVSRGEAWRDQPAQRAGRVQGCTRVRRRHRMCRRRTPGMPRGVGGQDARRPRLLGCVSFCLLFLCTSKERVSRAPQAGESP